MAKRGDCCWLRSAVSRCANACSPRYSNLSFRTDAGPYSFSTACDKHVEVRRVFHTSTTVEGPSTPYVVTPFGAWGR